MDDNDVREADVRVSSRKTPTLMRAGARVRIKGLKSRADLNGMDATVLAWMPGDRWGVRLASGVQVKVKLANLTLISGGADTAGSHGAGTYEAAGGDARAKDIMARMGMSLDGDSAEPSTERMMKLMESLMRGGGGRDAQLVPPPAGSYAFGGCLQCEMPVASPRVCSECLAVCYCSESCLEKDRQHAMLCAKWKEHAQRDTFVALPGDPSWVKACMLHNGKHDRRKILGALGLAGGIYGVACGLGSAVALVVYEDEHERTKHEREQARMVQGLGSPAPEIAVLPVGRSAEATPASWAEYYEARGFEPDSPVALLMTFPLTLFHILSKVVEADVLASGHKAVRVHYIGPEVKEMVLGPLYRELAVLMPAALIESECRHSNPPRPTREVDRPSLRLGPPLADPSPYPRRAVDMVGQLAATGFGVEKGASMVVETCAGARGGSVTVRWHDGIYDARRLEKLGRPDVAVALNAGLGAEQYEWGAAIDALEAHRTPFVVSGYTENELLIGTMGTVGGKLDLTMPIHLNPFRQPLRWPEATGKSMAVPWVCNGFLCGFNT